MQENEKDPEVQPVAEPVAAKAVAPVEENTGNGAETTLEIIANIVLVCGIIASIICLFNIVWVQNPEYQYIDDKIFSPSGFVTTVMVLASSLISWSFMRVLANISVTLKAMNKKMKESASPIAGNPHLSCNGMDGDCGYVAAADRVIAPVVRAALHGGCAVVANGQQGIGCECVRRCGDHHCWRVSDGADVRIRRYGCEVRTIRKLVSSDARRPRWSAAAWRYPPASPRYPPAS